MPSSCADACEERDRRAREATSIAAVVPVALCPELQGGGARPVMATTLP